MAQELVHGRPHQKARGCRLEPMTPANDSGHVRVGKTMVLMALTGSFSLFFGASRTAQTITLTFQNSRDAVSSAPSAPSRMYELALGSLVVIVLVVLWSLGSYCWSATHLTKPSGLREFCSTLREGNAMEVHFTPELEAKLAHEASEQGRTPADVVQEALTRYFAEEVRFREAVGRGE
jgi:hypothetical protein